MTSIKKVSASALMLFFTATAVTTYAQTPQEQQQDQQQQVTSQQDQSTSVSDDDLKKFAAVLPKVQEKSQKAQAEIVSVIEDNGMKTDRFQEIQMAKMQHQDSDASKEEMETFDKISGQLEVLQPKLQKDIEDVVTSGGLTLEKFQSIAMAIQTDQTLQAKLKGMMMGE